MAMFGMWFVTNGGVGGLTCGIRTTTDHGFRVMIAGRYLAFLLGPSAGRAGAAPTVNSPMPWSAARNYGLLVPSGSGPGVAPAAEGAGASTLRPQRSAAPDG